MSGNSHFPKATAQTLLLMGLEKGTGFYKWTQEADASHIRKRKSQKGQEPTFFASKLAAFDSQNFTYDSSWNWR